MEAEKPNHPEEIKDSRKAIVSYAKYTGIAFQMMAIIAVFAFAGYKLDKWFQHETPWITALFCVAGVFISIYQVIRQLKS